MVANGTIRDLTVPMLVIAGLLGGCAASQTMLAKKDLVVQAKTSTAVFVDPVAKAKRSVYLEVKSGVEPFDRRAFKQFGAGSADAWTFAWMRMKRGAQQQSLQKLSRCFITASVASSNRCRMPSLANWLTYVSRSVYQSCWTNR